jgi:hypothetical protein
MNERLASLSDLGPGPGIPSENPADIQDFAQRRVDHLRRKIDAGHLDAKGLQDRLVSRLGDAAGNVVGGDGVIDFEQLRNLIATQQATRLQDRLEGLLGDDAQGIVGPNGEIDRVKVGALKASRNFERLQERLFERFGERAQRIVSDDGSVDIGALRELFATSEDERPYEPTADRLSIGQAADAAKRFFYIQTWGLSRVD